MKPIFRFRSRVSCASVRPFTDCPSSQYFPLWNRSMQPRMFIRVLFPEPDGPSTARYSPAFTSREIPFSTSSLFSPWR